MSLKQRNMLRFKVLTAYLDAAFDKSVFLPKEYTTTKMFFIHYMNQLPMGASQNELMALATSSMRGDMPEPAIVALKPEFFKEHVESPIYKRWLKRVMLRSL